jgi:osmotically-inducible protein OsmY
MRLLTVLAVAAFAGGLYHFGSQRGRARQARLGRADERVAEAVRSAIAGKGSGRVHVRFANGVVALRGNLPSAERDRVLAAALTVPGVVQVTNLIETDDPVGDLGPMQSGIATGR